MKYYCKCFEDSPRDGQYDAEARAIVSIKLDCDGNDVTDEHLEWDYMTQIIEPCEEEDDIVTCGCCGEKVERYDN